MSRLLTSRILALKARRAILALGIALLVLPQTVGCVVTEDGADAIPEDADLVPADATALAAYLTTALERHPGVAMVRFDDTTGPVLFPTATPGSDGAVEAETPFSTTTLQTEGVDEPDLVKFDGETLFVAKQPIYHYRYLNPTEPIARPVLPGLELRVASDFAPGPIEEPEIEPATIALFAADDDPAQALPLSEIELPGAAYIQGMMLLPESEEGPPLLVVIATEQYGYGGYWRTDFAAPFMYGDGMLRLWIHDVSDPAEPVVLHEAKIQGSLISVRRIGQRLVLVTRLTPYLSYSITTGTPLQIEGVVALAEGDAEKIRPLEQIDVQELLPRYWPGLLTGDDAARPLVRPENCFVPRMLGEVKEGLFYDPTLTTVSSFDLRAPDEPVSICAAGRADRIYSSTRALYLVSTHWNGTSSSLVHKFAYTDRGPVFRGSARVPGTLIGSDPDFGMGEVDDVFGIMTLASVPEPELPFERTQRLTLIGEASDGSRRLEERSHLPNESEPARIGKPGEQLYGVRFIGHRVYAVTFRRIDPLYVIDIEDPRAPFIAGELEVPGFSDRLEAITPDLLLGIGKDSIEDGGRDWFQGVKLELFDVSDPSDPVSVDALVIGERGSESSARTDHHALTTLDMGDGTTRIAIPISVHAPQAGDEASDDPTVWYPWARTGLHLFEVHQATPALDAVGALIADEADGETQQTGTWQDRSRLQGEAIHYVHGEQVWSAPWASPEDSVGPR